MKIFGFYILLTFITRNPILSIAIALLLFFLLERRFVGLLPDITTPFRRANRIRELQKEVKINPANAEAYLELGETFLRRGQYEKAVSYLNNASTKMEDHPLFHFYLGASYYHLGRAGEGRVELEKAVAINPKVSFGEPYLYLARIYLKQKPDGDKTGYVYQQLMQYGSPGIHYLSGSLFLEHGDKDKARRFFNETIENYQVSRGSLRRSYRRWAALAKLGLFYSR